MGFIFRLLVTVAFSLASGEVNEICNLEKRSGDCGSVLPRYYFDKETGKCERFLYTGCGGNANNFGYQFECERYCPGDLDLGDICSLGPEPGIPGTNITCRAYIPRYYFNSALGKCDIFIFGGCGGNYNSFYTKEECERFCPPVPQLPFNRTECNQSPDPGNCGAYMQRYYYDKDTSECKTFTYGGCGSNRNNFETQEECEDKCGEVNEICKLDKESGDCGSVLHRYYFDKETGKCERFLYTGCGGNDNNFGYLYECERYCPGDLDLGDICSLDPEPGIPGTEIMCMAYFPRYYFNRALGECDVFVFGGCGGNHNNFYTKEECESFCPPVPQPPFNRTECDQSPDPGNCRAHMRRYYYDKDASECEYFTYGGCGGNRNNFKTQEECVDNCGAPGM